MSRQIVPCLANIFVHLRRTMLGSFVPSMAIVDSVVVQHRRLKQCLSVSLKSHRHIQRSINAYAEIDDLMRYRIMCREDMGYLWVGSPRVSARNGTQWGPRPNEILSYSIRVLHSCASALLGLDPIRRFRVRCRSRNLRKTDFWISPYAFFSISSEGTFLWTLRNDS